MLRHGDFRAAAKQVRAGRGADCRCLSLRDEFITESGGFDPMAADLLASVGAEDYLSLNGETAAPAEDVGL